MILGDWSHSSLFCQARQREEGRGDVRGGGSRSGGSGCFKCGEEVRIIQANVLNQNFWCCWISLNRNCRMMYWCNAHFQNRDTSQESALEVEEVEGRELRILDLCCSAGLEDLFCILSGGWSTIESYILLSGLYLVQKTTSLLILWWIHPLQFGIWIITCHTAIHWLL